MSRHFTKQETDLILKYYEKYKDVKDYVEQALLIKEELKKHGIDKSWNSITIKIKRLLGVYPVLTKDLTLEKYHNLKKKPISEQMVIGDGNDKIVIRKSKEDIEKETIKRAMDIISNRPNNKWFDFQAVECESTTKDKSKGITILYPKKEFIKDYIIVSRHTNSLYIFLDGVYFTGWKLSH